MKFQVFEELHNEVVVKNKNGVNFILAASICWLIIAVLWYLPGTVAAKAMYTFFATMPLLPLAFLFSKLFNTSWNIENNPLNRLGLWLNFAQLFYFPFIFIFFAKNPGEMPMALAIITGAHFFPYAWFYRTRSYAFAAGVISVGSALIGTSNVGNRPFWIALFLVVSLWFLALGCYYDYTKVRNRLKQQAA